MHVVESITAALSAVRHDGAGLTPARSEGSHAKGRQGSVAALAADIRRPCIAPGRSNAFASSVRGDSAMRDGDAQE